MENQLLTNALFYARDGFSVIPVDAKTKEPFCKWKEYQTRKATEDEITAWWTAHPNAGIGLVTGEISGIIVVDAERVADFDLFGCQDSDTPCVKTGGGGRHWYYQYEKGIKNAVKFAPSYDIRSDGGYCLVPPSDHKSGNKYEWIIPLGIVPYLPFPEAIKAILNKPENKVSIAKALSEVVTEGSRNNTAASVAGKLLARFKGQEWEQQAWPLFQAWNKAHNSPALEDSELRATFDSIARSEAGKTIPAFSYEFQEEVTDEGYLVKTQTEKGTAVFSFTAIENKGRRDLDSLVEVSLGFEGLSAEPFSGRLNVCSLSSREGFARSLSKSFSKDVPWDLLLARAVHKLQAWWNNRSEDIDLGSVLPGARQEFLLEPFVVKGLPNIIFGQGSSGKTTLALACCVAIATGRSFLHFAPQKAAKVLYLDYEADKETLSRRLRTLRSGNIFPGLATQDLIGKVRYWRAGGTSLPDLKEKLKKRVKEEGIEFIVVDSAVAACGGKAEDSDVVKEFFNALADVGVATLTIAHVSKSDNTAMPFGSSFWFNFPRNIWNVQKEQEVGELEFTSGVFHRKANESIKYPPEFIKWTYGKNDEGFDKVDIDYGDSSTFGAGTSATDRILDHLSKNGASHKKELVESLGDISANTIKVALGRLTRKGYIERQEDGKWLRLAK